MTAALASQSTIPYGARQFQEYIGRSTYRAFITTLSVFSLAGLAFVGANALKQPEPLTHIIPSGNITYIDNILLPKPAAAQSLKPTAPPAPAAPAKAVPTKPSMTTSFKPVPNTIPVEPVTFEPAAPVGNSNVENSTNTGTNTGGGDPVATNSGGTESATGTGIDMWDFNPVEKEPVVDYTALSKNLVYPDMAKRAGIEGKVQLRALIGADGKVVQAVVIDSDNQLLSRSAEQAVLKTWFSPAMQNGQPVTCWISIPIDFKLR